jgi:uncharacterized protein GlcG (DUF336 family)
MAALCVSVFLLAGPSAEAQDPPAYGPSITLAQARTVAQAAEAEAVKNRWPVAIVIVDTGGHMVLLHKLDNTQLGSIEVAERKAVSAVMFRRSTKTFEDGLTQPTGARFLAIPGAMPVEGGLPIMAGGRIIGAIGVSGVTSQQDGVVAAAGAATIK